MWNIENAADAYRERRPPIAPRLVHPNLPPDCAVDGIAQFDENRIVSKVPGSGIVFLWNLESALNCAENETESKMIEPEKIFNWSDTDEMYLNLNTTIKQGTVQAGDGNGRIWIYTV